jgi:hypothetical protein
VVLRGFVCPPDHYSVVYRGAPRCNVSIACSTVGAESSQLRPLRDRRQPESKGASR